MRGLHILSAAASAVAFAGFCSAAHAAPAMFIEADIVRGVPGATGAPCVLNSQFKHKEMVVWRIRVVSAKTGKPLDDKGLKSLVLKLSNGQTAAAHFGGHPPPKPVDMFWTATWVVPDDYPTGSFSYEISATDMKGRTAKFEPFKTLPSLPTIVADAK